MTTSAHRRRALAADLIGIPLQQIGLAGAHDPVASLMFCPVPRVALNVVQGRVLVRGGESTRIDLGGSRNTAA